MPSPARDQPALHPGAEEGEGAGVAVRRAGREQLPGGGAGGRAARLPCRCRRGGLSSASENPPRASTTPLLLFQKTEIYSVELSGSGDIEKTDKGHDKKYGGLKKDCLERKTHQPKEELKKELDLVS